MNIWNRLTTLRGERGDRTGLKKVKGSAKEHICITHGHRQQRGDGLRDEG